MKWCTGCRVFNRAIRRIISMPRATPDDCRARMLASNALIDAVWRKYPSTCAACQMRRFGL
jgi:hypothetical protein